MLTIEQRIAEFETKFGHSHSYFREVLDYVKTTLIEADAQAQQAGFKSGLERALRIVRKDEDRRYPVIEVLESELKTL